MEDVISNSIVHPQYHPMACPALFVELNVPTDSEGGLLNAACKIKGHHIMHLTSGIGYILPDWVWFCLHSLLSCGVFAYLCVCKCIMQCSKAVQSTKLTALSNAEISNPSTVPTGALILYMCSKFTTKTLHRVMNHNHHITPATESKPAIALREALPGTIRQSGDVSLRTPFTAYQKWRLCHGKRLKEKKGSPTIASIFVWDKSSSFSSANGLFSTVTAPDRLLARSN